MYSTHTTMHKKGNLTEKKNKKKQLETQLVQENTLVLGQSLQQPAVYDKACCKNDTRNDYAFFSFLLCTDVPR